VIDQFLASPPPPTDDRHRTTRPSTVTVSVLNGTGAYNQAATTAFALGASASTSSAPVTQTGR